MTYSAQARRHLRGTVCQGTAGTATEESMNRVIFRTWRDTGDVIAFLPDVLPIDPYYPSWMTSYQHIGQHSEADYYALTVQQGKGWESSATRLATPEEYAPLLAELHALGYEGLRVMKRLNQPKRSRSL